MKTYKIEGIRDFMRINDENGKLVAYVGGDSPQQMQQRAEAIIQVLNGSSAVKAEREACAKIAEEFGPSRPITKGVVSPLIRGRWEGEQAASGAIAHLIRARKP